MKSQGFDELGGSGGVFDAEGSRQAADPVGETAAEVPAAEAEDEVARYAAEVRAELADLSADDSAELLEDLEDHLREVAAEDAGVLRERLGGPAAYAAELRESAGLPPRSPGADSAPQPGAGRARRSLAELVTTGEQRIRANRFGAAALDFLPSLRPAWWVLRAWIAVRLLEVLTTDGSTSRPVEIVPRVGGSLLLGLPILIGAVTGSVWLARRGQPVGWRRGLVAAGQTMLVLFAVLTVAKSDPADQVYGGPVSWAAQQPSGPVVNGRPLTNLAVYDKDGKLLTDVFVYDQDGNPVNAPNEHTYGNAASPATWLDAGNIFVENMYPRETVVRVPNSTDGSWQTVPMPGPPPQRTVPKPVTHVPGGPDDCRGAAVLNDGVTQKTICNGLPAPTGSATPVTPSGSTASATPSQPSASTSQPSATPAPGASASSAPPSAPAPGTSSP